MSNPPTRNAVKKSRKKHKNKKSLFWRIFTGVFFLGCIIFLLGAGLFWYYAKEAPPLDDKELDAANSARMYAANGEFLQDIGSENREKINAADVPQLLEDAIVSVEDRRFYDHIGFDPIRIIGSAVSNIKNGGKQGGSTLTQQLIKLTYFSTKASDQTLKRKAQEAWLSVQLEKEKSKQEILTYYINKVYMANGLYGMQTASYAYYDKPLNELDLPQTALLAGLPNAPTFYDPYENPENAKNRRDIVLMTMLNNHKISQTEYDEAVATPITEGLQPKRPENNNWKYYDNYFKEAINEVKEKTGKDVYADGLEIHTNIDVKAQKRLYEIVNSDNYVEYPDDEMQVAATLIDTNTGKVTAQIGGRNVEEGTIFGKNLAVNTARDMGSTVKPITDYAPAFQYLKYSTATIVDDSPYNYVGTNLPLYNWDHKYMGNITIRKALYESRNVPAAKLFMDVGVDNINEFLNGLGIEYKELQQFNAISSNTSDYGHDKYGMSSEKVAAAYAAFANGGTYYKPQYVNKIVYQDGSEDVFVPKGKKAMDDTTAYMITDILKDVLKQSRGLNAIIPGLVQAGKTGTSNYTDDEIAKIGANYNVYPDISYAGYTPNYSLAVWTGYNDKIIPITDNSAHVATDVYRELMQFVSASINNTDWKMPNGLVRQGGELYFKDQLNEVPRGNAPIQDPPQQQQRRQQQVPQQQQQQVPQQQQQQQQQVPQQQQQPPVVTTPSSSKEAEINQSSKKSEIPIQSSQSIESPKPSESSQAVQQPETPPSTPPADSQPQQQPETPSSQ